MKNNKEYKDFNEEQMKDAKELPITLDIEFTVNLKDCLPLCIISAKENLKNWINQNFMLPVACVRPNGVFEYIITDGIGYGANYQNPESLIRHSFVCSSILQNVKDIVNLLIQRIDLNWYSVIFLDHYYISSSYAYQDRHYSHEMLIYGYDKKQQVFKAITYDSKMCIINISFAEIEKSFENELSIIKYTEGWDEYALILYQPIKHTRDYPFDQDLFADKLKMYVSGIVPDKIYFENLLYMRCNKQSCFFGIKANDAMLMKIRSDKAMFLDASMGEKRYRIFNQYLAIYTYSEFHKALLKRLIAFNSFSNKCKFDDAFVAEYNKIVEACEKVRLLYLKLNILLDKKDDNNILKTIDSIIKLLEFIDEFEPKVLIPVVKDLLR